MKKIIILGASKYAQLLRYYLENENNNLVEVVAYSVEENYFLSSESTDGLPIIKIEELNQKYPKKEFSCVSALGYTNMNTVRERIMKMIMNWGYEIENYYHPSSIISNKTDIGKGNVFFENVVIQPWSIIGDGNVFQASSILMHDNIVGNYNFFGAGCIVNGRVTIKDDNFIGSNSTIKNKVKIDSYALIGAGAYVSKDVNSHEVIVPNRSVLLDKNSMEMNI